MRPTPHQSRPRSLQLLLAVALGLTCCRAPAPEPAPADQPAAADPEPDALAEEPGAETAASEVGEPPAPDPTSGAAPEVAPAAAGVATEADTIVLARVNGVPLTLGQAIARFVTTHAGHGLLVRGEPAVRDLAARLVERRVFIAEAEVLGITEDPLVLDAVQAYRREAAEIVFWEEEVDRQVVVPDDEVEAFYLKTRTALAIHVLEVEDRARAEELRQEALDGGDLDALAEEESTYETPSFGGSMPYVRRGELEETLDEAAFALEEPGSLSPVVETANGFAFVRLDERIENPNELSRETAYPQIRNVLKGRALERRREDVMDRLTSAADIEIDEERATREAVLGSIPDDTVVARSAGDVLTMEDLRGLLNLPAISAATAEEVDPAVAELVDKWATRKAIRLGVKESGLLDHPRVEEQTAVFRQDAILSQLHRRYVYADLEMTEETVRAYYEEHLADKYTSAAEVRLRYMVVATQEDVERVQARLAAGEDFGAVAREESIDPTSRAHGGRGGWMVESELLPPVAEAASGLQPDESAGPIETDVGFFFLKLLERREERVLPFEMAFRPAGEALKKELQNEAHRVWAERLEERADVEIDEEGIQAAVAYLEREHELREAEEALQEASEALMVPNDEPGGPPPAAPQDTERSESQ